jgi:hypothetical protein
MPFDNVCAVILNWNGAEQTIRCIHSVDAHCHIPIIVIDNHSDTNDYERLERFLSETEGSDLFIVSEHDSRQHGQKHSRCLIKNDDNYGYAGGNNIGIDYAYRAGYEYIWILNNDILVEAGALQALLRTINSDEHCGFCASILVYSDNPTIVQCVGGGKLYPWLGKARLMGKNLDRAELGKYLTTLPKPDYLMGASLLIRRAVIQQVGLMDEHYFMYAEEVDWQRRSATAGFSCLVANDSFAQHGDSASTRHRSHMFHFYRNRAAIMYNKKFHSMPCYVFSAVALAAITALQNMGNFKNIKYGIMGIMEGLYFSWR